MSDIKVLKKDNLNVKIMPDRKTMGITAGSEIADKIRELLKSKDELNMIFAAAPSQNEVLECLVSQEDIEWERINAFHMDEYIGLDEKAPQRFGNFLKNSIFGKVNFKNVYYINGSATNIEEECERYANLLKEHPVDIVCLGIGENAHIAFNDPWVALFDDEKIIKPVELDEVCRNQQVNDGCFKVLSDVPTHALTLTIPTLFSGKYLFCTVPAKTKAQAVFNTLNSEISTEVPATIMRKHENANMYCDKDSAELL